MENNFFHLPAHYFSLFLLHEQAERVHELNEEIGKLLARAEQLGGEGNVDEAQQLLEKVEKTRALKKEAEVRNSIPTLLCHLSCGRIEAIVCTYCHLIKMVYKAFSLSLRIEKMTRNTIYCL